MPDPYSTFGLSCPSGGSFYICQNNRTEFIGCCTIDPCRDGSGSCPQENVRSSSLSADSYDVIAPQDCAADTGLWYTCKFNKPPFLGCCASNPCQSGACQTEDLVPAKLSTDPDFREGFLGTAANLTSASTTTGSPTSSSSNTSIADSNIPTATPLATTAGRLTTGTVVGISVGVVIVVLLLIAGCTFVFRRGYHARKRKERGSTTPFLSSPPEGRFKSPISSPAFTPYRDSQAYSSLGTALGIGSPSPFSAQSPPTSNYPFSPYNGSVAVDAPMPGFMNHARSFSNMSELDTQPAKIQELETEHNSRDFARHELPAESAAPASAITESMRNSEAARHPPSASNSQEAGQLQESPIMAPSVSPIPPHPIRRSEESSKSAQKTPTSRTPVSRRSRESSINKELPKTPPRTPPPVVVSPETSPTLVSRFSASRRRVMDGMDIIESPGMSFSGSPRGRESVSLLSPETPGRRSGSFVFGDGRYARG
ncbi:hypothetical protein GE09DRAFT_369997 [Coniochaeta sp. 2T2.1]|nr:hypothetical protein GE09DRAFT_369997 [Coniochaeta sp. 2T2.1]